MFSWIHTEVSDERRLDIPSQGSRFRMREKRASDLSSAGNPVSLGAPVFCMRAWRLLQVARGVWRHRGLSMWSLSSSEPKYLSHYRSISKCMNFHCMGYKNQSNRGWGSDLHVSTYRRERLTSTSSHKHSKRRQRQAGHKAKPPGAGHVLNWHVLKRWVTQKAVPSDQFWNSQSTPGTCCDIRMYSMNRWTSVEDKQSK